LLVGGKAPLIEKGIQQMTTHGKETPAAPVSNLRAARKEQAQARAASKANHPAGKAAAPAKKAPAKAPAKKAAAKAPAKVQTAKVRWTRLQEGTRAVEQDATCGGHTWQIRRADGGWTVTQDGKQLTEKPIAYAAAGRLVLDAAKAVAA
jgi:hypothetical protein